MIVAIVIMVILTTIIVIMMRFQLAGSGWARYTQGVSAVDVHYVCSICALHVHYVCITCASAQADRQGSHQR